MNMLSFLGQTPTIALRNAQAECGEDAIVVSTKKISDKKTSDEDMYEVVVAIENKNLNTATNQKPIMTKVITTNTNDNVKSANLYDFKNEILQMHNAIEKVQKSLWEPKSQLFDLNIPIPPGAPPAPLLPPHKAKILPSGVVIILFTSERINLP